MYGKVFTQMYEGTLASRGPWQALVTFQQLIVLANKHGEVDMTAEAISRRTTIPLDIIHFGLEALQKDDPESRTPDENGKRIAPIDPNRSWGWRIVNYEKYRRIRSEEERREYMRDFMAHKRARNRDEKLAPVSDVSLGSKQYAVSSRQEKHTAPSAQGVRGPTRAASSLEQENREAGFDAFWVRWPQKQAKDAARQAWRKVPLAEYGPLMAGIEKYLTSEQWQRGVIPHAATWLNQKRWKDEDIPQQKGGTHGKASAIGTALAGFRQLEKTA